MHAAPLLSMSMSPLDFILNLICCSLSPASIRANVCFKYCVLALFPTIYIYPEGARCSSQDNKSARLCHESVCVCEEKWVRTFKIQDKISHIEASFLLQTVLICILQRPWLVAVFQIWWWIIHLHSRGFVCERVCVCVLKTLRLVSCRFPLRIKKQRSLPVHRPAGRVDQPGEPVQPGPGRQTTRSHILSGPGGEQSWCFSSGFFFFFIMLCSSSVLRGDSHNVFLCFVQLVFIGTNTFILVNH